MCHVVVIGAGITGVTTAYELSQLGYQVTVVDRHLFSCDGNFFCKWWTTVCMQCGSLEPKINSAERHEMDVSKICATVAESIF